MAGADYLRFFPYERPYDDQRDAMDRVHTALVRGQHVLFEGACGTGKTLSALVPALEFAREHDKTVVITTNVHQQTRQFVREARAITRQEPIRAVVFRGKSSMCHIDVDYEECQVLRDTTRELVEAEDDHEQLKRREQELLAESRAGTDGAADARAAVVDELGAIEDEIAELRETTVCDHYYRNLTEDTEEFYAWLYDDVRTPEEIYAFADREGLCGYELLKEGMESVDLVVCNYHHLLDPTIREQFFRWLDRDPGDVITVFDEAHNVEDAARDHATRTCSERTFDAALDELADTDDARAAAAANVLEAFRDALVAAYEDELGFGQRERIGDAWEDLPIANEDGRDDLAVGFLRRYTGQGYDGDLEVAIDLGEDLDEAYENAYRRGDDSTRRECQTLQAARFVRTWMDEGTDRGKHPVLAVRRDAATGTVYGRAELYTCIPSHVTRSLFEEVYASVLMSATLRPFDVLADVLGLDSPVELAYGLDFPPENRRTFAVGTPPLFSSDRDDPDVVATVAGAVADAVRFTPGTVLVFCPSYAEASRYADRLGPTGPGEAVDATVYLDEPGTRAEDLRQRFVDDDDGVLLTSLWGTLAEGVSFDGDDAATVLVVGVPYPQLNDRAEAVQNAYAAAFADRPGDPGWEYAVEIPTVRKTRQALGRVIRSPEEVGVRALLDQRYTATHEDDLGKYSVRDTFPSEEREEMIDVAPGKLKFAMLNFFAGHDAYDGDPPTP